MSVRVGINGFGRIGRNVFRAAQESDADIEIVNPALVLCTASENVEVEMDILVGHGRGYVPGETHDLGDYDIGLIPMDSNFSPIRKVAYTVESRLKATTVL